MMMNVKTTIKMKANILGIILLITGTVYAQQVPVIIQGATIHVGNGQVIENGYFGFAEGKIFLCNDKLDATYKNATLIDGKGKHIYPGIIAMGNVLGLSEIEAVRATIDFRETGDINPNVRSLIAYNTDSKVISTVLSNGVLFTQPVPQGGLISGTSSLMRTSAWNWEDAAYKTDDGVHLNWPESMSYSGWWAEPGSAQAKKNEKELEILRLFFEQADQYSKTAKSETFNARLDAMKGVLTGTKNMYVHVNGAKSIIQVIQFFKQYPGVKTVLVEATDAYLVKDLIKEKNIPVVITNIHQLPMHNHSDIDQPYKTAVELMRAGILVAIGHTGSWDIRNLMFNAGTTVAYGLSKEEALQCITSNAAKIIGVENTIGTLEKNKDASFIVSSGDILDMRTSNVEQAYLDGKAINLDNVQKQLYGKYMDKYNLPK
jgi:imidazolonepropionase-like amidohydrolase